MKKQNMLSLPIPEQIAEQQQLEGQLKSEFKPLKAPIIAEGHSALYKMHRYFARRPHNVFRTLIKNFSNSGQIILDPFCGGGVTIVEGLRTKRKMIGIDINPTATFITRMEVKGVPIEELNKRKNKIEKAIAKKILSLYETQCPKCGGKANAVWIEWSYVVKCPVCNSPVNLGFAEKIKKEGATFICTNSECHSKFRVDDDICKNRIKEAITRIKYECESCSGKGIKIADAQDEIINANIEEIFAQQEANGLLKYPKDALPDGNLVRENSIYQKGFFSFADFYTKRNLLALSWLYESIRNLAGEQEEHFLFTFSSMLYECTCHLCHIKDGTVVKPGHDWWPPLIFASNNVWKHFITRFNSMQRGIEEVNSDIGTFYKEAADFNQLKSTATCMIINGSSEKMPLPDNCIDVIITDPPFGSNVQYGEMTDLWAIWLKDILGMDGLTNKADEAIMTRHSGFANAKSLQDYEDKLCDIFKECNRVLKTNGWLVLTFHNRDIAVWMALQRAANRAGFKLPLANEDPNRGMLYRPPIEQYTTTLRQQPAGAMLGDFILSFKRQDIASFEQIDSTLSTEEENCIIEKAKELMVYHGGADNNILMTGLIPFFTENNLLHKVANKDFNSLFNGHFKWVSKEKKWFPYDMVDSNTDSVKPIDHIPAEEFVEQIVYSFLKSKRYASLDEIVTAIYSQLVNSHRPGMSAINKVLNKLCDEVPLPGKSKRNGYALKTKNIEKDAIKKPQTAIQQSLFGQAKMVSELDHNEIIELICTNALDRGYEVHVGETEQKKLPKFNKISKIMANNTEFGLPMNVFETILEIDLLVIKGTCIIFAVEVATTVETADKAVNNRFRNMIKSSPNSVINSILIVKDKDMNKANKIIYSEANKKDNISKKITLMGLSELTKEKFEEMFKD